MCQQAEIMSEVWSMCQQAENNEGELRNLEGGAEKFGGRSSEIWRERKVLGNPCPSEAVYMFVCLFSSAWSVL